MKFTLLVMSVLVAIVLVAGCATTNPPTSTPTATATSTPTPTVTTTSTAISTPTQTSTPIPTQVTVGVGSNTSVGGYLVNGQGMALYYFARDIPDTDTSACNGACAALWPPFSGTSLTTEDPLVASIFNSITRSDGQTQYTYGGWPLYQYSHDTAPGTVNGNGYLGIWYVMSPGYTVFIMDNSSAGRYLADPEGRTLYVFARDTPGSGTSACSGVCQSLWTPFRAQTVFAPSDIPASDFSTITGEGGELQTTYKGWPLYHYTGDTKAGELNGQDYLGLWSAAAVGTSSPLTVTPAATTAASATTMPTNPYSY
jgi:predicted lipoprotein with Yx(FWY)xxD motif